MHEKIKVYNDIKDYLKRECDKTNILIQEQIINLFRKESDNEELRYVLKSETFGNNESLKNIILENYIELKRNKISDIIELFFEVYYERNKDLFFILWNFKKIYNKNLQLEKIISYKKLFNYEVNFQYLNFVKCKFNYPTKRIINLLKVHF